MTPSVDAVGEAIAAAGFAMPMLCCSPDFTHPDPDARRRAVDHQATMIRVARRIGGEGVVCRVLSGQRHPRVGSPRRARPGGPLHRGVAWKWPEELGVVLGLENHYKDGFWAHPEFAQKADVFLALLDAIPDRDHFGVQFDPSNAIVAGR